MKAINRIFCLFAVVTGVLVFDSRASGATANVTVNNTTYTLTTQYLSYTGNEASFQSQPWWGNEALAYAISAQLKYQLGDVSGGSNTSIPSALLGYGTSGGYTSITFWQGSGATNCPSSCPLNNTAEYYVFAVNSQSRAIPTLTDWGMVIMAALMGLLGLNGIRRHNA